MATVPRGSIPSMSSQFQSMKVDNRSEKALMVRIGTLIDAIVEAQRGLANPGAGSRRSNVDNLKKPRLLTGNTENLFNAVAVNLDPSSSAANMSHQEVQIDTNIGFSNPTQKQVFANNATFKGLVDGTVYNVRARPVMKNGQVGDWAILDQVATTSSTSSADLDGDKLGATVESKVFTISRSSQQFFCGAALGFLSVTETVTVPPIPSGGTTPTQTKVKDRIGDSGTYTDIETITLPGVAISAITATDGLSSMQVKRSNPILFFTLITPTVSDFPAGRTLDVQIAQGTGAFANSTKDTVWTEF